MQAVFFTINASIPDVEQEALVATINRWEEVKQAIPYTDVPLQNAYLAYIKKEVDANEIMERLFTLHGVETVALPADK